MKKYIALIVSVFALNTSIQAQQFTTVDLFDMTTNISYGHEGYYHKDVNNYLNQFVGNWRFTLNMNGQQYKVYEVKFAKKTFTRTYPGTGGTFKYDALVGEMRIVKQGTEIYNGFNNLNQNYTNDTQYNIYNFNRVENGNCNNCTIPYQRLQMRYREPDNDNRKFNDLNFVMHTYVQNGKTYLRIDFPQSTIKFETENRYDADLPVTKTELFFNFGTYNFERFY